MLEVPEVCYVKISTVSLWLSYITNINLYYEAIDWDDDDEIEYFFNSGHNLMWYIDYIPDKPELDSFHLLVRIESYKYALDYLDPISIQEDAVDSIRNICEKYNLKILGIQQFKPSLLDNIEFRSRYYPCIYKQHVIMFYKLHSPAVCVLKISDTLNNTNTEELLLDVEVCKI